MAITYETFEGIMENAYGKKLPEPIKFGGTYPSYGEYSDVPADKLPTEKEIVDFLNAKSKANERQKSMQAALDAAKIVRPTLENDEQLRLRRMYDIFIANGSSHDEARVQAATNLKLTWAN